MTSKYITIAQARDYYFHAKYSKKLANLLIMETSRREHVLFPNSIQQQKDCAAIIEEDLEKIQKIQVCLFMLKSFLYLQNDLEWKLCTQHNHNRIDIDSRYNLKAVLDTLFREGFLGKTILYGDFTHAVVLVSESITEKIDDFIQKTSLGSTNYQLPYNTDKLKGPHIRQYNKLLVYCINNLKTINGTYNTSYKSVHEIPVKVFEQIASQQNIGLTTEQVRNLKTDLGKPKK